jgi:hypothetical protein
MGDRRLRSRIGLESSFRVNRLELSAYREGLCRLARFLTEEDRSVGPLWESHDRAY